MSLTSYLKSQPLIIAATILGAALIAATAVGGYTAYSLRAAADVIEVTGSAKVPVTADFGRWTITLEARTGLSNQAEGYTRIESATQKILSYLQSQGLTEVETPAASTMPTFTYPQNSEPFQTGHQINRTLIVRSAAVETLIALASDVGPLLGSDYTVSSGGVELTYQNLPETRVSLLSEAINDAKARAEAIAKESGRSVGSLRSASGGVVQVLPAGGVDVSDYGSYDTQNLNKEVMVTVRATFSLR
jgi:hypothetical protein